MVFPRAPQSYPEVQTAPARPAVILTAELTFRALASPVAAWGASSPGAFSLLIHVLGDVTLVLATLFSVRTRLILERGGLCPR